MLALWDDVIGVDDAAGAVSWAGLDEGMGWMDHARDTTEYWIHERQLREGVGRPHVEADEVAAVVDILGRGLPHALRDIGARDGAHVALQATDLDLVWRVASREGRWWFAGHAPMADGGGGTAAFATIIGTGDGFWRRWSRHPAGGRGAFTTRGDAAAALAVVDHLAVIRRPD